MTKTTATSRLLGGAVLMAFCLLSSSATAATISLDFTGLGVVFANDDLVDAGGSGAAPLTSVTVETNSFLNTYTTDVSADFIIPDVDPIPATGGVVSTGDTGGFTLSLPGGDFVMFDLGPATVSFVDIGFASFTFAASVADVGSVTQSLPAGLIIGDPITVSIQTTIVPGSLTTSNGFVTGFRANGTGAIDGQLIPEPSSLALVGLLIGLGAIRTRSFAT